MHTKYTFLTFVHTILFVMVPLDKVIKVISHNPFTEEGSI